MKIIQKTWNKIKNPKGWQLALFYVVFAILVSSTIVLVVTQEKQTFVNYLLYFLSFIALAYFVYTAIIITPKIKKFIIKWLEKYKFTRIMLRNYGYRTIVFSVFSFLFNTAYMAFLIVIAIINHSYWYFAVGIYYFVLSSIKGFIFLRKYRHKSKTKQVLTYKICGIMFIVLTQALIGIISLIYFTSYTITYAGLSIYVVAVYTFYRLTLAIYNYFKAKKQDDLYIRAIRNVNLCSALVSLLVLQVALIHAFSPNHNETIFNMLTGAAVGTVLLTLGIFMIIRANKILNNKELFKNNVTMSKKRLKQEAQLITPINQKENY